MPTFGAAFVSFRRVVASSVCKFSCLVFLSCSSNQVPSAQKERPAIATYAIQVQSRIHDRTFNWGPNGDRSFPIVFIISLMSLGRLFDPHSVPPTSSPCLRYF